MDTHTITHVHAARRLAGALVVALLFTGGITGAAIVTAAPAAAVDVVDSGRTCGTTSFWTIYGGIPVMWRYQGYTSSRGAHKHLWNGYKFGGGSAAYWNYRSVGWCTDRH